MLVGELVQSKWKSVDQTVFAETFLVPSGWIW